MNYYFESRMQSTIALFRHLYKNIPPLFPKEMSEKMAHALSHLEKDQTVTLDEIEDTMIAFGYEVWPWNQAYKEFVAAAETQIGEHSLLPRLSLPLQKKYHDFKSFGGSLRDLHSGRPADYFSPEDRVELCEALVEMQIDLRQYAKQEVCGVSKQKYLKRVAEFTTLLQDIKKNLDSMRQLAGKEQDHPTLADEIRARVRGFEHGLCLLGPELEYHAVCNSLEFFHGRKQEMNRMKGINEPLQVDFYNE